MKRYKNVVDQLLLKEIIISKGKGKLTEKGSLMLIELSKKIFTPYQGRYNDTDIKYDVYMSGLERMFLNWRKFNLKYDKCIPYFFELFKRGTAEGYNIIVEHKYSGTMEPMKMIRFTQ